MKEQTKTIRIRVLRPFFLTRDRIAQPEEEHDVDTDVGMAAVHAGKAERLTESHRAIPTPPPPVVDAFLTPDADKRKKKGPRDA